MTPKSAIDSRPKIQEALCAAAQVAQDLQARYSLVSILTADGADGPYDDFWRAVDLLAVEYFNSYDEIANAIERSVPIPAGDGLLGLHFDRCDGVARAALVLGLGWALVDRRGFAHDRPVH